MLTENEYERFHMALIYYLDKSHIKVRDNLKYQKYHTQFYINYSLSVFLNECNCS